MPDTVEQIISDVAGIADVDPLLARTWVRDAGRRTLEAHNWSWLLKRAQLSIPATLTSVTESATASVTDGDDSVPLSAAIATADWVGRQFRTGSGQPVYDIVDMVSASEITIRPAFQGTTNATSAWEIFQSRVMLPTDTIRVFSVVDPLNKWQLHLDVPIEQLDAYDSARSHDVGNACLLAPFDYWEDPDSGDIQIPRMELYRHPSAQTVYQYSYIARYPDITDSGVSLPGLLLYRGDIIREKALEFAAAYPGTVDRPNASQQINRRDYHAANWRMMVEELARQDNERFQRVVGTSFRFPYAPLPWDSGDMQLHDPYWIYPV